MITWNELSAGERIGLLHIADGYTIDASLWSDLNALDLVGVKYGTGLSNVDYLTDLGRAVLAQKAQPASGEGETFGKLCEREIVKIRDLVLYDDEYTSDLLGDAVGSPTGVTLCVEARMKQIVDLKAEIALLKTQMKRLKRTAKLDEGFIDFLTEKGDNHDY